MVDAAVLVGRYQLIELIGQGVVAEVWRAMDTALGRQVAVKLWSSYDASEDGAVAGVVREARDAARLVHPNVARVYDIGADDDQLFLVTELVTGRDLAAVLAQYGPLPTAWVAQIGAQAARVLAAAHADGIVHGGLKPGNLLITADGTVKVTDFGAAASPATANHESDVPSGDLTDGDGRLADAGVVYVSPEQAVGVPAAPPSDLYALGCVLYELLVERPPFTNDGRRTVLRQHVEDEPVPPGRLRPDIPAELEHAVLRMLAKNPADRPASADRIVEVLQAVEVIQSITDA